MKTENDITRFLEIQNNPFSGYAVALKEIQLGKKTSHWIWYIFPQLRHLGRSSRAYYYGIADREEAMKYLEHETLSGRLREISMALLEHKNLSAVRILGKIDAMKVQSCMTLFDILSPNDVFGDVLNALYDGQRDVRTVEILIKN